MLHKTYEGLKLLDIKDKIIECIDMQTVNLVVCGPADMQLLVLVICI